MTNEFVGRHKKVARAELERVAEVYREAALAGEKPARAVRGLGYPAATASRRIAAARAAGLLDSNAVGSHGHVNLKALRIANTLGVSYSALVAAVREHANGDLRLGDLA